MKAFVRAGINGIVIPTALAGAAGAARAADLPVAVEPIDYLRVCDAYGNGFYYIPGTETTCFRVSGRARGDYNLYVAPDDSPGIFDDRGFEDTDDQGYRFRARGNIYLDSRTATEFGLLRTYLEIETTLNSLSRGDGALETGISLEQGYIQYGGFTFGRIQSFFDFLDPVYTPAQTFDPAYSDNNQNVLAYTFEFDKLAATVSIEDNTSRRYGVAEGRYGGAQIPDIVGQLRYEGDAITAQLQAAGHYINAIGVVTPNNPARGPFRVTDEAYGFAVGGGASVKVPFGNDTSIGGWADYAHGALLYLSRDIGSPYGVFDAAFGRDAGRDIALSDGFSVGAGFETSFTDTVSFAFNVGYLYVDMPDSATDFDEDGKRDDLDVQNLDVQGYLAYRPVSDFELGLGAEYRLIDTEDFGEGSLLTTYFRAQRRF